MSGCVDNGTEILEAIPNDLVDLRKAAKRLDMEPRHLRELSQRGEFPAIHQCSERIWKVSESEVLEWWKRQDLSTVRRNDEQRREWVDAEASKRGRKGA